MINSKKATALCESGGIGRRAGFRFQYRKVYGFKSRLSYHFGLGENKQKAALR